MASATAASAASVAGLRKLRSSGVIEKGEYVVCLATGTLLKDPDAASFSREAPKEIPATMEEVMRAILN